VNARTKQNVVVNKLGHIGSSTLSLKKGYHPTTNDNFNRGCPIPVIFGTNIAE